MKMTQKLLYALAGFVIGNSVLALLGFGAYYYSSLGETLPQLTLDAAVSRIADPALSEVRFEKDRVIFTGGKDSAVLLHPTDGQREILWSKISDQLNRNGASFRVSEEPQTEGSLSRLMLSSAMPFWLLMGIPTIVIILLLVLILFRLNEKSSR